jgi:LysM repeat protein
MRKNRWVAVGTALFIFFAVVTAVSAFTYTVEPGDTLYGIAREFNTTVDSILQVNAIPNPNYIVVGQQIEVPGEGADSPPTDPAPPPPENPAPPPTSPGSTYTVQPGDTLFAIALRFNTTVAALVQANGITNPNYIGVGQQLIIPGGSGGDTGGGGEYSAPGRSCTAADDAERFCPGRSGNRLGPRRLDESGGHDLGEIPAEMDAWRRSRPRGRLHQRCACPGI